MEQRIEIERLEQAVNIFGSFDENIRLIEQHYAVSILSRDSDLKVTGEPEAVAKETETMCNEILAREKAISEEAIAAAQASFADTRAKIEGQ